MAAAVKFEGFVGYLGLAAINLNTDLFEIYGTNATPSASADDVKVDLAAITEQNGYTESDVTNTYSEASGTGTMGATTVVWTASGGSFGPFRYVVCFDETVASPVVDPLMCYWDYGSAVTVLDTETFTTTFTNLATLV